MASIQIRALRKAFGATQVLRGVDLAIEAGEFVSLVGASGCGKSTLLRILAGLERADGGEVRIEGRRVDGLAPGDRDLAMVFQSYALYPHLTVRENLAVPLKVRRLDRWQRLPGIGPWLPGARAARAGIDREVEAAAEALDIAHLLDRRPGQLSGGQRQRTALGRAMVRRPKAFLMDEPLSNLDANLRVQMRGEIAALHRSLGATFVYVTHDQTEAMTMSDRVAVMQGGELLQVDTPSAIYFDPACLAVARFVGNPGINLLECLPDAAGLLVHAGRTLPLAVPAAVRAPVTLGLRPEAIRTVPAGEGALQAVVTGHEHLGSDLMVALAVRDSSASLVARRPGTDAAPARGATVGVDLDVARALAFDDAGRRLHTLQVGHG